MHGTLTTRTRTLTTRTRTIVCKHVAHAHSRPFNISSTDCRFPSRLVSRLRPLSLSPCALLSVSLSSVSPSLCSYVCLGPCRHSVVSVWSVVLCRPLSSVVSLPLFLCRRLSSGVIRRLSVICSPFYSLSPSPSLPPSLPLPLPPVLPLSVALSPCACSLSCATQSSSSRQLKAAAS